MKQALRRVLLARGRYAAPAPLSAHPVATGAALGTAALVAVLSFSAAGRTDLPTTAVGSTVMSSRAASPEPSRASTPEIDQAHFDGANALRALADTAAAREAAELAELAEAPDAGAVTTATVDPAHVLASGFIKPVIGVQSSPFGIRFHPILHVWKLHSGTDLAATCGTSVKAVKAGQVTMVGGYRGYGNRVVIDHGGGLVTTYNHLSSYAATIGMPVRQGQIIGYVGSTGMSTGCHLHFEVMVNGAFVDPAPYLDLAPAPKVVIPPAVPPRSDVSLTPTHAPTTTTATATTAPTSSTATTTDTATVTVTSTDAPTRTAGPLSTSVPTTTDPTTTADPTTTTTSEPTTTTATPEPTTTTDPTTTTPDPTTSAPTPTPDPTTTTDPTAP